MRKAIKEVYKDMPQLKDEALKWFERNWRKYQLKDWEGKYK